MKTDLRNTATFMITGLAVGHSVFHWIIQSFVVLLPEIQQNFGLSAVAIGGLLASREMSSGIIRLPAGIVSDMLRTHWGFVLSACLLIGGLGALAIGISAQYVFLLLGIALISMAHSVWHLPSSAALSYHFPAHRGLAISFHGVGGSVGDVAGPAVTGLLLMIFSWRGIINLYSLGPFVLGVLSVWCFYRIGRIPENNLTHKSISYLFAAKELLEDPVIWGITIIRGLRGMALVALLTVLPLYLGNELGINPIGRGIHIGLLIAMGLFSKPIAGFCSDRWGRKNILVPSLVWSSIMALVLVLMDQGVGLTVSIALLGLFLYPDQPILTAATLEIIGTNVSATALGIATFASFIMSATSPVIAGFLYQNLGMNWALFYVSALFAMSGLMMVLIPLRPRVMVSGRT